LRKHECEQSRSAGSPEAGDLLSNLEAVLDVIAVKVKKIFFYDEKFLDLARLAEFAQMLATRGISIGCSTRYSTPFELSDSINARQSSGRGIALLMCRRPKLEQDLQTFLRRKPAVIIARGCFCLRESSELGDDRLHRFILSRDARKSYCKHKGKPAYIVAGSRGSTHFEVPRRSWPCPFTGGTPVAPQNESLPEIVMNSLSPLHLMYSKPQAR